MARRRLGAAGARSLAQSPSLEAALDRLAGTAYGHDVKRTHTLAEAQHAIAATLLWHFRVLAGWMPWQGTPVLRLVAGVFEILNVEDLLRTGEGLPALPPYELGALGTAWSRLSAAAGPAEVHEVLSSSAWAPIGEGDRAVQLGMRLNLAGRALGELPLDWVLSAAAILVAREHLLSGRELTGSVRRGAVTLIGREAVDAASLPAFLAELPPPAAWVLAGITEPSELWRAELAWWHRLEHDGFSLLRTGRFDPDPLLGAAAVLSADAWRVRASLEIAARGGTDLEAFDVVA
jgi:hypothetical protein